MYKAIIYDIDGTLLDTIKMNMYPLMRIIKEELNEDRTYEEVRHFFSYSGKATLEELGISYDVYPRWVQYVNEYEQGAEVFEGVVPLLTTLQDKNIIQAVVSAKTHNQYHIDMEKGDLEKFFEIAVLFEDTVKHKPEPEPILECLKRLGLNKNEVLYVGDALADYKAAKAAEVDFALASWCGVIPEGLEKYPLTFDHPLSLLRYLEYKI